MHIINPRRMRKDYDKPFCLSGAATTRAATYFVCMLKIWYHIISFLCFVQILLKTRSKVLATLILLITSAFFASRVTRQETAMTFQED